MSASATVRHVLGPQEGESVNLLALGVRFMIDGERTGGAFSLLEHPLPPRALGAPVHRGRRPRVQAARRPARVLECGRRAGAPARDHSPAGFEGYFREVAPLLATPERDEAALGEVVARYELDIDFDTIPVLAERHGLRLGG